MKPEDTTDPLDLFHTQTSLLSRISRSLIEIEQLHLRTHTKLEQLNRSVEGWQTRENQVTVTDVEMSFWSMVTFMVKWVLASIPAAVILLATGLTLVVALRILGLLAR